MKFVVNMFLMVFKAGVFAIVSGWLNNLSRKLTEVVVKAVESGYNEAKGKVSAFTAAA